MALLPLTSQFWLLLVIFIPVGFISSSNGTQFSPESLFSAPNSKTKQKQQNPDVSLWRNFRNQIYILSKLNLTPVQLFDI